MQKTFRQLVKMINPDFPGGPVVKTAAPNIWCRQINKQNLKRKNIQWQKTCK